VAVLQTKFGDNPNIKVICGDFFEHQGQYDLIIEQTFLCLTLAYVKICLENAPTLNTNYNYRLTI
jgi:hypothetical protein